jgi:regulatory protein
MSMRAARGRQPATARATALRLLARRDYSRMELAQRLRGRGAPTDEIDAILDDLERLGYLSDARYAQAIVSQRAGRLGARAIVRDLHGKGIPSDTAKDALASLAPRDELADATALWARRFGTPPANDREKARHVRFLVSRGYSASVAFKVLHAAGARTDET